MKIKSKVHQGEKLYPIIPLAEGLVIPSFFLVISVVLCISIVWVTTRAKLYQIAQKDVLDLSLVLMVASLAGSRLFHVFYENPEYYSQAPAKVLSLWDGGFVFYGGAIAAFLAALFYFIFAKTPNRGDYFDTFAPVLAFAYGAGRIGCFLAGCCYGKACDLPWSIDGRHPTQLYAFFWEMGAVLLLLGLEKRSILRRPGNLFLLWALLHSVGRFLMESFREDFRGEQMLGLSVSSVFSIGLFLIASALLLVRRPLPE